MFEEKQEIAAPVTKAAAALGAGAGTSVVSVLQDSASFLPTNLAGWVSLIASAAALFLTLCYLAEFWVKKIWRPYFRKQPLFSESSKAPLS